MRSRAIVLRGEDIAEGPEIAADVVEHAIEDHPDSLIVESGDAFGKGVVGPKTSVDGEIISGVVSMRCGFKHRSQKEAVDAKGAQVRNPFEELCQARPGGGGEIVAQRSTAAAQGVDVIKNRLAAPMTQWGESLKHA